MVKIQKLVRTGFCISANDLNYTAISYGMNTDDVSCYAYIFAPKYAVTNAFEINCWKMIKIMSLEYGYAWYYKNTAFSRGCYGRLPQEEEISPETKSRVIFFLSEVIYRNTLNQRQYVLYYTECPSEGGIVEGGIVEGGIAEGGIAGCRISLQYHSLLWWAGLRKVREKYHIYIYQWIYRIIKEICIKYNIVIYHILIVYNAFYTMW